MNYGTPQEMYDDDEQSNAQGNGGCFLLSILIFIILIYNLC
jgi:hypothetical protein